MKTRNLFALFLFCALMPGIAAAQEMKTLPGHVPAVVSRHHLKSNGSLAPETSMNLAIGLPLRNTGALSNLLEQIYDPASPNYHHYLTPKQFTEQFGPSEEDYQTMANFAKVHNLTVVRTHSNRMLLDVRGRASDIEKAFQITLRTYHHPTENRDFYAPDSNPSVPSILPIQDIAGLDNYRQPQAQYHLKSAVSSGKPQATTGSGPDGTYIGNDFRNAYIPGTTLNGSGQTIALVEFDGYLSNDITEYEGMAVRTNIPLQNVLLDGFSGAPTGDGGEVEVSLDIEMLVSMCPALARIVVYEGNPFNFFPNDVLNQIATDDTASQISSSWSWSGGPSATSDHIFQEMDLQGQTYYNAVGDQDAFTAGPNSVNGVDNPDVPHTPSDSPYITQVGGTTLTMNGAGVSYASETVWNWDIRYGPSEDGVGTCGGISSFYPIPNWQTNINMTQAQGSTTFRNMPDVALTADDVFVIADGGVFYPGTGGTSCAAPLWAGFTALANQQATNNGLAPMGFINPALYAIGSSANYTNCFHDVKTGNNTWSSSPNLFFAVSNYDLCTGLGTPNGTNLINALASVATTNVFTHISPPLAPYGTNMANLNGGNPNGSWYLFIQDNQAQNAGMVSNGWIVTLTTANPVGFVADDGLSMSATPTNLLEGYDATITIGVQNYGPSTSSNIIVSDTFPSGFTLVSSTPSMGTVLPNAGGLSWSVGNLAVTASAQLTLILQAPDGAEQNAVNFAGVSADTPDLNSADSSASVILNVVQSPSMPTLSGLSYGNGQFHLTASGSSSFPVIIQSSTNLVNWVSISTNTPPFTFTDTVSSSFPDRFYRALVQ